MPGYTTVDRVEHSLNPLTFTDAQRAECSLLIPVAEQWIDDKTGRVWGTVSAVAAESYVVRAAPWTEGSSPVDVVYDLSWYPPATLQLRTRPVASIQSVSVRTSAIGSTLQALTAGTQYELLDAEQGLLNVANGYGGWLALVSYTPAVSVPPRIELAATKLVAYWMRGSLTGIGALSASGGAATSYQVGDVRISYGSPTASSIASTAERGLLGIPDDVIALLPRPLVFA
jgi:hypothetical protein